MNALKIARTPHLVKFWCNLKESPKQRRLSDNRRTGSQMRARGSSGAVAQKKRKAFKPENEIA